jgi:hypothetical protein
VLNSAIRCELEAPEEQVSSDGSDLVVMGGGGGDGGGVGFGGGDGGTTRRGGGSSGVMVVEVGGGAGADHMGLLSHSGTRFLSCLLFASPMDPMPMENSRLGFQVSTDQSRMWSLRCSL